MGGRPAFASSALAAGTSRARISSSRPLRPDRDISSSSTAAAAAADTALHAGSDTIEIDVTAHELRLHVEAEELAGRRAAWTPPAPHYVGGVWAKYAALVSSASDGAITTGKRLKRALDTAAE